MADSRADAWRVHLRGEAPNRRIALINIKPSLEFIRGLLGGRAFRAAHAAYRFSPEGRSLASRFGLLPLGVEGQYFKPVHDGWLFGAPRPWLSFGRRPTYLVTDAQKAMLAARIRTSRYIRLLLGIPLVVTAPFWVNLVPSLSQVGNTVLVFGLYLNSVHFIEYLMIRSQLTDLPRTAERMFMVSMVRQQSEAMSVRSQARLCVLFGLITALMVGGLRFAEPAEQDFLRFVALASGLFFTIWLGMLLLAIWRSWHPGAVPPDPNSDRSS